MLRPVRFAESVNSREGRLWLPTHCAKGAQWMGTYGVVDTSFENALKPVLFIAGVVNWKFVA